MFKCSNIYVFDLPQAPREVDPNNTSIFVGGLPEGYNPERLSAAFAHYGQ
jgi:RNA recognition motif-containing protein